MIRKCFKCGYKWSSRVEKPKECPDCKNRDWNKKIKWGKSLNEVSRI